MSTGGDMVRLAASYLRSRLDVPPRLMVVLGSGLSGWAGRMEGAERIPYAEVPGFARTTVPGHPGELVVAPLEGVPALVMRGRFHVYEGHDRETIVLPVRVAAALGVELLVVTGAAGAIEPALVPGSLMLLEGHLDLLWEAPRGADAAWARPGGDYDPALRALALEVGRSRGIDVATGVYAAVPGPSFETPAEIRMLHRLGAHAVGMSIVPEAVTGARVGMRVAGVALVSNPAAGLAGRPLDHEEVMAAATEAGHRLEALLRGVAARIAVGDVR